MSGCEASLSCRPCPPGPAKRPPVVSNCRFSVEQRVDDRRCSSYRLMMRSTVVASLEASRDHDHEVARVCKALANPTRVQIVRHLLAREGCVCGELVDLVGLAQSTVSEHLRILKGADLLVGEVDGPRVCYCVNPQAAAMLKGLLELL